MIHHLQSFANLYQQALGSYVLKRFIRMLDQSERNTVLGQALFIGVSSLTRHSDSLSAQAVESVSHRFIVVGCFVMCFRGFLGYIY